MAFLYEEIDTLKKYGSHKDIPDYITKGLSSNIILRDYQKQALENFLLYVEGAASKNKQIWNLFHMATGSGKTVIIACLILYFYKKGYRNFIFFVKNISIVDKTIDNLTNNLSSKYLFSTPLEIDGKNIRINKVFNFQNNQTEDINICFTSNAGLNNSLSLFPIEDQLSKSDFEDNKVVMIADESHHLNAVTKNGQFVFEESEDSSWESTVMSAFRANKDNVLLEFTATCDVKNPFVEQKYKDVIIFDYPLSKFREDKYSKDIISLPSTDDLLKRSFIAILISHYRYKLFLDIRYNVKPIIMLKSKNIKHGTEFYEKYLNFIHSELNEEYINQIRNNNYNVSFLKEVFDYFDSKGLSSEQLVQEIKIDFAEEHCISLNSKSGKISNEDAKFLNSLENPNNPYRLIFVVDMLNEGWDVLNLYDIVRLYDTRDGMWTRGGKYIPGKTTISEQQLIGRGARYFPFKIESWQEADKRKFDNQTNNPLRICETLIYHCTTDNRYITEIKIALKESGLVSNSEPTKIELKVKDNFKEDKFYKNGKIILNKRIEKSRSNIKSISPKFRSTVIDHDISPNVGSMIGLFDYNQIQTSTKLNTSIKINEIPINILHKGIRQFPVLYFDKLQAKFPNLRNIEEFLLSDDYIGAMHINFSYPAKYKISSLDILDGYLKLLNELAVYVSKIEIQYEGTKQFFEEPISKYIVDVITYKEIQQGSMHGEGIAQSRDDHYRLDLSNQDWYVYNENYGTSEEKSFVKYFSSIVEEFRKKYVKVFLIRNEQQFGIYSFSSGDRFEPDYVLVLSNDEYKKGTLYYQIFIEPKGNQFLGDDGTFISGKEGWKEQFLRDIVENKIEHKVFIDDTVYRIWGLPFYNEQNTYNLFDKEIRKFI